MAAREVPVLSGSCGSNNLQETEGDATQTVLIDFERSDGAVVFIVCPEYSCWNRVYDDTVSGSWEDGMDAIIYLQCQ